MLNQTLPFIRYINRDSKTARTMNWENHLIKDLQWSNEIINREAKERVAREIAATAKNRRCDRGRLRFHRLPHFV